MEPESQIHFRAKLFILKIIAISFENGNWEPDSLENKIIHWKYDRKKFWECHPRARFTWEQNYSFQRWSQEVIRMTSERQFQLRAKLFIPKMIARSFENALESQIHLRTKLFIQNMIAISFENATGEPDLLESKIMHSKDDRKKFWECQLRARFTWEQNYSC